MTPPKWVHKGHRNRGCLNAGPWDQALQPGDDLTPGFGFVRLYRQQGRHKLTRGAWGDQAPLATFLAYRVRWWGKPGQVWRVEAVGPLAEATYRWDWATERFWLERTGSGFA